MIDGPSRYVRFVMGIDRISKLLQKCKNSKLEPFGLHSMHLMFLFRLYNSDEGMTCTELAESCSVDKAFISRVTNEMREKGYVDYAENIEPRYKKRLRLTEYGKNVMTEVEGIISETIAEVTKNIGEDQLAVFYQVLGEISNGLIEVTDSGAE